MTNLAFTIDSGKPDTPPDVLVIHTGVGNQTHAWGEWAEGAVAWLTERYGWTMERRGRRVHVWLDTITTPDPLPDRPMVDRGVSLPRFKCLEKDP